MADFTTVAIFATCDENSHFPVLAGSRVPKSMQPTFDVI